MEKLCPVCNSICEKHVICYKCGNYMEDMGRNSQYYDSYSCDIEIETNGVCTHLYQCKSCNAENLVKIQEIFI